MRGALLLLAACGALAAGCKKGATSLCTSDVHCAAGFLCNPATGACGCGSDAACADTEQCNAAGFCQPRLRCLSTADCGAGSICDSPSGACIAGQTCTLDVQCSQGTVCDTSEFACEAGCRKTGDCPLGTVCRPCPAGTQCRTGSQCVLGPCDTQLSCPYGDYCSPDSSGDTVCARDPQGRPFCQPCARKGGTVEFCSGTANFCLIDTSKPFGQAFYCGIDCSEHGQTECPNGYTCRDIRIVTAQTCSVSDGLSACPGTVNLACDPSKNHPRTDGRPGVINDACEAATPSLVGAVCNPKTNTCTAQCIPGNESAVDAFCSCVRDEDCPTDACDSATHACSISGKPCIVGRTPDDCQSTSRIFCVKVSDPRLGDIGYCRIGQNCAPSEGFTCDRLLSGG